MEPVRLVQFTDTHLFGSDADTLRGIATFAALRATLRQAEAAVQESSAVLVTGDLVQDDPLGYPRFRTAFGELGRPVLTLPGNHDDLPAMRRALSGGPYQYCGHADFGAWRVVMVDSVKAGSASGYLGAEAQQSLSESLRTSGDRHVLVCLHHHPVPMRSRWIDTVGLENPSDFFRILDAHRNVRAVLWGHVHQPYDGERNGVRLLATPSTCAQFLPYADDFAIDPRPPAYRILELAANGAVHTELRWLDSFSVKRRLGLLFGLVSCLVGGLGLGNTALARERPLLWALHGPHNTVYIAGSMHMLPADRSAASDGLDRAYADAEKLVMEIDMDDLDPAAAAAWTLQHGVYAADSGRTLRTVLGEERWRRIDAATTKAGLPLAAVSQFQPWLVALTFTQLQLQTLGLAVDQGVESKLTERAKVDHKPIAGLETMEQQLGLFAGLSEADQIRFLDQTIEDGTDAQQQIDALVAAWRRGDERDLTRKLLEEYARFPRLYDALVRTRNAAWIPQLQAMLSGNDDYLVVVGALHLVGDEGVIAMLERAGLKPVRVSSESTRH